MDVGFDPSSVSAHPPSRAIPLRLSLAVCALVFALAPLAAPAAAQQQRPAASPCADSLYQALRSRPLQELSEREYEFFMQREKACTEYQTLNRLVNAPKQAAPAPAPSRRPPTEAYTRGRTLGSGAEVYVRNVSDRPIIVNSVRVYDCVRVRESDCGMHYPKVRIKPGQARRVVTIRFHEGEGQRSSYRYQYNTTTVES